MALAVLVDDGVMEGLTVGVNDVVTELDGVGVAVVVWVEVVVPVVVGEAVGEEESVAVLEGVAVAVGCRPKMSNGNCSHQKNDFNNTTNCKSIDSHLQK